MRHLLQILVCSLMLVSACQQTSPQAQMAEREKDLINARKMILAGEFKRAEQILEICARAGHGGCAQTLGAAYQAGKWVPLDTEKARNWLTLAYNTGIQNGFSGVYGALGLSLMSCNAGQGGYPAFQQWLDRAQGLLDLLGARKHLMASKTEQALQSLNRRVELMGENVTRENCPEG